MNEKSKTETTTDVTDVKALIFLLHTEWKQTDYYKRLNRLTSKQN